MPGFNPDKINIHELTIGEPEKESALPFDAEKDISPGEWEIIMSYIKNKNGPDWIQSVMQMKVLKPDYDLNLDEQAKQFLKNEFERGKGLLPHIFALKAAAIKLVDPTLKMNIDGETWERMEEKLDVFRNIQDWSQFLNLAFAMKILEKNYKVDISKKEYKAIMDQFADDTKHNEGWRIAATMAQLRVVDPNRNLKIDDAAWECMHHQLEDWRFGDYDGFFQIAVDMQILAAEKVEVTDKGLEITMPARNLQIETPQIPEQRNF